MTKAVLFSSNIGDITADLAFRNNFAGTTAPGVSDDADDGYVVGSVWVDTSGDLSYICVDATAGAAVWLLMGESGIDPDELALLNGAAAGTVVASKAVAYGSDSLIYTANGTLSAAGNAQGNAAQIVDQYTVVTGADDAKGVALPAAADNKVVVIENNDTSHALLIYPVNSGNDTINALSANLPVTIGAGQQATFIAISATQWFVSYMNLITPGPTQMNLLAQGVAAGYKVARGTHTQAAASDTIATGLATVVAVVASFKSGPTVKQLFLHADVGNQSGAPAAGSFLMNTYKPTAVNDVTPTAATDFTDNVKIDWVAIGT